MGQYYTDPGCGQLFLKFSSLGGDVLLGEPVVDDKNGGYSDYEDEEEDGVVENDDIGLKRWSLLGKLNILIS